MLKTEALILAAGLSRRMQGNKLLLELSGQSVIERTLANILASKIYGATLVVGYQKDQLMQKLRRYNISFVENLNFTEGMGSSIREGIKFLARERSEIDSVLILPGDMPLVRPETVNRLLKAYSETGSHIIVPVFQGQRGHPVLFDKKMFNELLKLSGDVGARNILKKCAGEIFWVNVNDPGIHIDVDNWEDYLSAKDYFKE